MCVCTHSIKLRSRERVGTDTAVPETKMARVSGAIRMPGGKSEGCVESVAVSLYRTTVVFQDDDGDPPPPVPELDCVVKLCRLEAGDEHKSSKFEREGAIYHLFDDEPRVVSSLFYGRLTAAAPYVTIHTRVVTLDRRLFGILGGVSPSRTFVAIVTLYNPHIMSVRDFVLKKRRPLPRMFLVDACRVLRRLRTLYGFCHWDLHYLNQMIDIRTGNFHVLDFDLSTVSLDAKGTASAMHEDPCLKVELERDASGPSEYYSIVMLNNVVTFLVNLIRSNAVTKYDTPPSHENKDVMSMILGNAYDIMMVYNGTRRNHRYLRTNTLVCIPDMVYPPDYGAYLAALSLAETIPELTYHLHRVMDNWINNKTPDISRDDIINWRTRVSQHIHVLFSAALFVAISRFSMTRKKLAGIIPSLLQKWASV